VPQNNDVKLRLYALYKQATEGSAGHSSASPFDPVAGAKFDAWARLRGMARGRAKLRYIAEVERLLSGA